MACHPSHETILKARMPRSSARDAPEPDPLDRPSPRLDFLACAVLVLGLCALYLPPGIFAPGHSLNGIDFGGIHDRRIEFAQEHIREHGASLPGWYPRELMGTPFWSNIQSFPFLPTRLALLWIPHDLVFPVAVNLAAALAAVFTYLFLRRLGVGRLGSIAGGFTFAASGFFASRVLAGHLPLLEAFGALPLLLWLVEGIAELPPDDPRRRRRFLGLALGSFCVVLAGHPQVPAYATAAAAVYALLRGPRGAWSTTFAAIACGVAASAFVWWPMLQLIGRSTRILPLDPPVNDLAFPYWRLKAFFFPWADGWPTTVPRLPAKVFADPDGAKFWDTVCYVGWWPWIAALFLLERTIRGRRPLDRRWTLLAAIGFGAFLLSLPAAQEITSSFRVTLLRSPARLLYVSTFALSAGAAVAIDAVARARVVAFRHAGALGAVAILAVHALDLGRHDKAFVEVSDRFKYDAAELETWRKAVGEQRCAFDYTLLSPGNRAVDDVGFFDSIMLARPYRAFMALAQAPETTNVQVMDGAALPPAALAGLCAQSLITAAPRSDLPVMRQLDVATTYRVPDPAKRASFVPDEAVAFVGDELVLDRFRRGVVELAGRMFLSPAVKPAVLPAAERATEGVREGAPEGAPGPRVEYQRPDTDAILVCMESPRAGYVRVVEAWDEGWSAILDGAPAQILIADTFAMAVRVPRGKHEVRFEFRTPGARTGLWISAASAVLVALLAFRLGRARKTV